MHALRERERKHLCRSRKECYGGRTNETNLPLSGKGECHTDEPFGGRQVGPDQTNAVKEQSGKKLATAGTIKGPLPCPEKRIEKQRVFTE